MRDPPPTSGTSRSPWLTARETKRFKVFFTFTFSLTIFPFPSSRGMSAVLQLALRIIRVFQFWVKEKNERISSEMRKYPFFPVLAQARPILQTQTMQSASGPGQSYFCSSLPEYYRLIIYLSGRDTAVSSSQQRSGTLSWTATWWGTWWSRGRARSATRSGVTAPSSLTRTPAGTTSRWQTFLNVGFTRRWH